MRMTFTNVIMDIRNLCVCDTDYLHNTLNDSFLEDEGDDE
jgi:hypothetical protein